MTSMAAPSVPGRMAPRDIGPDSCGGRGILGSMNFARLARQNQRTHLPGRAFPMTEPTTRTLDVPGAVLHYDIRTSESTTEPPLPLVAVGDQRQRRGRQRARLRGQDPKQVRTLVAHEPPAAQGLPDRQALLAACTDIRQTYQSSGFGPAMAKLIVLAGDQGLVPADYGYRPRSGPGCFRAARRGRWLAGRPARRAEQAAESRQVSALPSVAFQPRNAGPGGLLTGAAGHPWYTALGSCPGG